MVWRVKNRMKADRGDGFDFYHRIDRVDESVRATKRPGVAGAKIIIIGVSLGLVLLWVAFLIWLAIRYIV
jgi:hypothetical protein